MVLVIQKIDERKQFNTANKTQKYLRAIFINQ